MDQPTSPTIASQIAATRRRLGLTVNQYGQRYGCTGPTVSRWENGLRTPPGPILIRMIEKGDVVVQPDTTIRTLPQTDTGATAALGS